jgi:hypothetical protein
VTPNFFNAFQCWLRQRLLHQKIPQGYLEYRRNAGGQTNGQLCLNKTTRLTQTDVEVSHETQAIILLGENQIKKTHLASNKINTLSATLEDAFDKVPKPL